MLFSVEADIWTRGGICGGILRMWNVVLFASAVNLLVFFFQDILFFGCPLSLFIVLSDGIYSPRRYVLLRAFNTVPAVGGARRGVRVWDRCG